MKLAVNAPLDVGIDFISFHLSTEGSYMNDLLVGVL